MLRHNTIVGNRDGVSRSRAARQSLGHEQRLDDQCGDGRRLLFHRHRGSLCRRTTRWLSSLNGGSSMNNNEIALAPTSLPRTPPLEFIAAAAAAGYDSVGLRLHRSPAYPEWFPIVGDAPLMRDVKSASGDLGPPLARHLHVLSATRDRPGRHAPGHGVRRANWVPVTRN